MCYCFLLTVQRYGDSRIPASVCYELYIALLSKISIAKRIFMPFALLI